MRALLLLPMVIGCETTPTPYTADLNTSDAPGGDQLVEGVWMANSFNPQSDTCRLYNPTNPFLYFPESFELAFQDGGGFTIEGEDYEWTCSLSGNGFSCDTVTQRDPLPYDIVGDFVWETSVSGVFLSESEMSAKPIIVLDCDGSGCNQVEPVLKITLPCTLTAEVPASAQGV